MLRMFLAYELPLLIKVNFICFFVYEHAISSLSSPSRRRDDYNSSGVKFNLGNSMQFSAQIIR